MNFQVGLLFEGAHYLTDKNAALVEAHAGVLIGALARDVWGKQGLCVRAALKSSRWERPTGKPFTRLQLKINFGRGKVSIP